MMGRLFLSNISKLQKVNHIISSTAFEPISIKFYVNSLTVTKVISNEFIYQNQIHNYVFMEFLSPSQFVFKIT